MNYRKNLALIALSATALCASANATAQEEEASTFMLSMLELHVKGGHDSDFRDGIKAWKECYLENEGEGSWNMWRRLQGQGNVYVATFRMDSWADMDTADEASQACQDVAREKITPYTHTEKNTRALVESMPEYSRTGEQVDVVWVTNFRVSDGRMMMDVVEKVSDAITQVEGQPRGYWYNVMGGHEKAADYFVVSPFENFAAMDVEREGVWSIVTKVHGEEEMERLRAQFMESMDAGWSYVYTRIGDLSHSQ